MYLQKYPYSSSASVKLSLFKTIENILSLNNIYILMIFVCLHTKHVQRIQKQAQVLNILKIRLPGIYRLHKQTIKIITRRYKNQ